VLQAHLGCDATDPFMNSHPASTRGALAAYDIGAVTDCVRDPATEAYRALRARLEAEGMQYGSGSEAYYAAAGVRAACALVLALSCTLLTDAWPAHLLGAALLGVFWQQLAFVGHDLGHNGVSGRRALDGARGLLFGPALTGISFSWWKATHNAHHVSTNSAEDDPDVQHMPLIAVSSHFFGSLWSSYHAKRMFFSSCTRAMVTRQHLFFYPLMFFARWNLYFQGVCSLALGRRSLAAAAEVAALLFFYAWVGALVGAAGRGEAHLLPALAVRLAFLLTCNGVAGGLHVQIVLSHFSQPTRLGRAGQGGTSFLHDQLAGTMNITLPPALDFVFGGLQFQVEHHLFPRLPAHALRALAPVVRALAKEHGLPYKEASFWDANVQLYRTLRRVAKEAEALSGSDLDAAVLDHRLMDALLLRG
jgi:fatty acid desaturase